MIESNQFRNLAIGWQRLQPEEGADRNSIDAGRIMLAAGVLSGIPTTIMGGDVTLSDHQLDLDAHLDAPLPKLPTVNANEWAGHVVALMGPEDQEWLVDLSAGQHWTNGVFAQKFEPAVCHVSEYDASFADDEIHSPLAVQYRNGAVFVTVRARPDLPRIDFTPTSEDFDLAAKLIAIANSEPAR